MQTEAYEPEPTIIDGRWVFPDGTSLPIVAGGDGDEDDEPIERPEDFSTLTVAQLTALRERAIARVAAIRALEATEMTPALAAEVRSLSSLANECTTTIVAAREAADDIVEIPEPPAPAPVVETPPAAAPEPPAPVVDLDVPAETVPVPEPMAASAAGVSIDDLDGDPAAPSPGDQPGQHRVFTAAAGSHQIADAGAEVTIDQLGEILGHELRVAAGLVQTVKMGGAATIHAASQVVRIASVSLNGPVGHDDRLGRLNSAARNTELIHTAHHPETDDDRLAARTAAICGPPDTLRNIPNCIGHGRPVRAMFRQRPSEHAAFQWIPSIGLSSVASGVTVWTDANQALVQEYDPDTWKPCVDIVCADVETAEPKRIPSCLRAEVMQNMSTPEQVANWVDTIGAQTERVAEGALLDTITALSHAYTVTTGHYGAIPTLYDAVSNLLSLAADQNRLFDVSDYVLLVQSGFTRRLALDSISREFTVEREIARMTGELGIRLETTLDFEFTGGASPWAGSFPLNPVGDAPVEVPDAPDTWRVWLLDPRAATFFSPDEFRFGMNRGDPQLLRQNIIQWFGELFEGMLKQGCNPWFVIDIDLCPNGDRAAGSTPIPCDFGTAPVAGRFGAPADFTSAVDSAIDVINDAVAARLDAALAQFNEAVANLDPAGMKDALAAADAAAGKPKK